MAEDKGLRQQARRVLSWLVGVDGIGTGTRREICLPVPWFPGA